MSGVKMPRWYVRWCELQSRAVWLGQITEREATVGLSVFHRLALVEALGQVTA